MIIIIIDIFIVITVIIVIIVNSNLVIWITFSFLINRRVLPPINIKSLTKLQLQLQLEVQHDEKITVTKILSENAKKSILSSLQNFEISLRKLKNFSNSEEIENIIELKNDEEIEKEVEKEVEEEEEDNAPPTPAMQLVLDILKR